MTGEEKPQARLKLTKSGRGVLFVVPVPELGVSLTYITSVQFLTQLLKKELSGELLGCKFLGEGDLYQFLSRNERELVAAGAVNVQTVDGNPLGATASKQRERLKQQITDDW